MSEAERKGAFVVASVVLVAVAVALIALRSGGGDSHAHTPATVIAQHTPQVALQPDPDSPRARARSFVEAYMHYEVGELGPDVKRALRDNATPALARRLLSAPPRPPAGRRVPAPGTIAELDAATPLDDAVIVYDADIDYDGTPSTLSVTLRRSSLGWRVSKLA